SADAWKMTVVGAGLLTVTVTAAEVVRLPAASRATAVSVWLPLVTVVVSHVFVYGPAVSSVPRLAPSTLNCTPTTPTLSLAVAETVTAVPDTVAPVAGAVIETVGGVGSGGPLGAKTTSTQKFFALNVCVGKPLLGANRYTPSPPS